MTDRPSNFSLLFGAAVSICLHLTVLVPLLLMAMTATPRESQPLQAQLAAEEIAQSERKPLPEEPELGIDRGTPSSVSWIGYEEYEEHLAQLAEVEQAAFTRDPSGAMGTADDWTPIEEALPADDAIETAAAPEPAPSELSPEPIDESALDEPADAAAAQKAMQSAMEADDELTAASKPAETIEWPQPNPLHVELSEELVTLTEDTHETIADIPAHDEDSILEAQPEEAADSDDEVDDRDGVESIAPSQVEDEPMIEEAETTDELELPDEMPGETEAVEPVDEPRETDAAEAAVESDAEVEVDAAVDANAEREADAEAEAEVEAESKPQRESEPDDSRDPHRDAPPGEVREGEESDKDADATSVLDVPRENWRLGRPLASKGVEIKPERPRFTLFQLTTASPRNPTVVIRFNREGVPNDASILRSSGDRSIDSAILASLYRWRAEGDAIKELKEKQTFDIQIRILLVHERRVIE